MKVVITGDTGFKGAWLSLVLQRRGDDVVGLALPPDDPRGVYSVACDHEHRDVDIRDADAVRAALDDVRPDVVFHLAAQALVRRSYAEPALTYETNVVGTANVLDALPSSVGAVVVVTSDKVYRQDGTPRAFVESDPLGGNDPYSASKACCELLVAEWSRRSPIPVATARAGNVIGGGDRAADRLLPDVVRAVESGATTRKRNPGATRPWQHVLEPLRGYVLLADRLLAGDAPPALNLGPVGSATVAAVLDRFIAALGAGSWERDKGEHPHEAPTLALDPSLARDALGWEPKLDLEESVALTAAWYRAQLDGADMRKLTLEQIEEHG
jgi:CDP-glucose 4,6-dehydratase